MKNTLAKRISSTINSSKEIKTSQKVGSNQIIIKETVSPFLNVVLDDPRDVGDLVHLECIATAKNIDKGNFLLGYCVVEAITGNGELVQNKYFDPRGDYSVDIRNRYSALIESSDSYSYNKLKWIISLNRLIKDSRWPVDTWKVRVHVYTSADVNVEFYESGRF